MSNDARSLPDRDQRIAALEALLAERDTALADARAELQNRDLLIQTLRVQIARLRRMQFGRSSEKLDRQIEQLELALEELEAEAATIEVSKTAPSAPERPAAVRALPAHLSREEVVHEPATGSCACPSCGGVLRPLGRDVDELLDVVPVSWRVVRHVRPSPAFQRCCASPEPSRLASPKYSCRSCERIVQAPAPAKAIARGKATFGTLAHVVVSKFDHHLPLYRQTEMMAAQGVELDRSTLAGGTGQGSSYAKRSWKAGGGWTGQAAALLDPIVSRIRDEGLKATKIHTDDTPVPVLDPGRGRTATGRLWVYAVDDRASGAATPPLIWYRFTPDPSGLHPQRELAGFSGHLQADAYAGYNKLYESGRVAEVACWAEQPKVPAMRSIVGRLRRGTSGAGSSMSTAFRRRRSPPTSSSALARFMPSRPAYAANRPMSGQGRGKNRAGRWSTRSAPSSTMRCDACRPSRKRPRLVATASSYGRR